MTETSAPHAEAPQTGDAFLDADPQELARRDPSRTAAEWAAVQASDRLELERRDRLPLINSQAEIPAFASEDEEAAFWDAHEPGPGLQAEAQRRVATGTFPLPPIDRSRLRPAAWPNALTPKPPKELGPISLRLEADTVRRLRALAAKKGTKYQTLLKTFVQERLYEEEKREGLVG